MTANEVMTLAKAGELLQLSPVLRTDEVLVGWINLGTLEIYKRFTLKTEEALITLVEGKTIYSIDGTDPDVELSGNLPLYVIGAYGIASDLTITQNMTSLPLNVEDNVESVNVIGYDKVQVPLITEGSLISLIYAAKPNVVTVHALNEQIDLPDQFVEPLLHYIGYRAHGSMDGNIQTESNTHYMRFEAACERIKQLGVGISSDDINMDQRLAGRGFI